ncbi:YcxB family protein [Bosea sp. 685]|uniref:YcxB family protein n=1 Tax=Bosea sp. 685 TaxID=3080057 RepID=UPI0028936EA0|nr:YcxB family protein [Bosea sp. 685]WNJ93369.1 YcxB family protein [Bosea sp. 685]
MHRKVIFTLNELDLRRAGRLHVFSSARNARTMIRMSILWIGAMAVLSGYLYLLGMPWPELRENLPVFALVISAATFGVSFIFPLALGPIIIRRRFRQDKLLRQAGTVNWDEEAYTVEQPGIYNRIQWGDYSKWREDRHVFVLFRSDYTYQVLPKRVLAREQIEDIQRLLSTRSRNGIF